MSIFFKITAVTSVILVFAYIIGQFTTKSIHTETKINAPANVVWRTLTNTEDFVSWNPFITRLEGQLTKGNRLSVTISPPDLSPMKFTPTVLVSESDKELRWVGRVIVNGIFDGEHYFELVPQTDGSTLFLHGEKFSGMLVFAIFPFIGESTRKGFEAMNKAMKFQAESQI